MESFSKLRVRIGCWERKGIFIFLFILFIFFPQKQLVFLIKGNTLLFKVLPNSLFLLPSVEILTSSFFRLTNTDIATKVIHLKI